MIVDRRELDFVLYELFKVEEILGHPRFAAYDRSAIGQMLDTAQQIAEEKFLPTPSPSLRSMSTAVALVCLAMLVRASCAVR